VGIVEIVGEELGCIERVPGWAGSVGFWVGTFVVGLIHTTGTFVVMHVSPTHAQSLPCAFVMHSSWLIFSSQEPTGEDCSFLKLEALCAISVEPLRFCVVVCNGELFAILLLQAYAMSPSQSRNNKGRFRSQKVEISRFMIGCLRLKHRTRPTADSFWPCRLCVQDMDAVPTTFLSSECVHSFAGSMQGVRAEEEFAVSSATKINMLQPSQHR